VAETTPAYPVTPIAFEDDVICSQCGARMWPCNYTAFPSRQKHIMWRCSNDPDHISSMLPLPK
jgi:hypothetical protein